MAEIREFCKSDSGKFKVVGVDHFHNDKLWVHGKYDTAKEAVNIARQYTERNGANASDPSMAIIFYAYDPEGNYLGGDTWDDDK